MPTSIWEGAGKVFAVNYESQKQQVCEEVRVGNFEGRITELECQLAECREEQEETEDLIIQAENAINRAWERFERGSYDFGMEHLAKALAVLGERE